MNYEGGLVDRVGLRVVALATAAFASIAGGSALAGTINVDFGGGGTDTTTVTGWNNITNSTNGSVVNAVQADGSASAVTIAISNAFATTNSNGTTSPTGAAAAYPGTATKDSFYVNNRLDANTNPLDEYGEVTVSGLAVGQTYDLTFFASRLSVSDNRSTRYFVGAASTTLNATGNSTNVATLAGVAPDALGQIVIGVERAAANTSPYGYLGILQVTGAIPVPEPSGVACAAAVAAAGLLRRRRTARR